MFLHHDKEVFKEIIVETGNHVKRHTFSSIESMPPSTKSHFFISLFSLWQALPRFLHLLPGTGHRQAS